MSDRFKAARAFKEEHMNALAASVAKEKDKAEETATKAEKTLPEADTAQEKTEPKKRTSEKKQKDDKPKVKLSKKVNRILWSLILMPFVVALHLFVCLNLYLTAIVTYTLSAFLVVTAVSIYLYYSLSDKLRRLYYDKFYWKPVLYTIAYYLLFNAEYYVAYFLYLGKVRTQEGYLFEVDGAFFSYVFDTFPVVIAFHLVLALIRWLVRIVIKLIKKRSGKTKNK